jgi:hypothetical protein
MVRNLLALLLVLSVAPATFAATQFPFTIVRDANGKLTRIDLPKGSSKNSGPDLLMLLRAAANSRGVLASVQASDLSSADLDTKEEKNALEAAKTFFARGFSKRDLDDPRLDVEFEKAKLKLDQLLVYRLLANPWDPGAFDQENATKDAIQAIMQAANQVFDVTPPLMIFEFLVDQYLEGMESRREFHQNRLLVLLEQPDAPFSIYEKSLVRSSVFYSRLELYDVGGRKKARKSWNTFGDTKLKSTLSKCDGYVSKTEHGYGPCFKNSGTEIRNRLVDLNLLSNSTSLAYDFGSPYRVRNNRIGYLVLKLALKFVPAPGWAKLGVNRYISSHFAKQRRSEGYVYEFARVQNQPDVAAWIAIGSANPMLDL